jgi:hypothetical protein
MAGILVGMTLERLPARNHLVLAVAIVLADAADADGSNIYPSVARVARLARCSERAVQTSLQELQAQGYLELVERGGGRGRPARYRIDRAWLEAQPSLVGGNGAGGAPFAETVHGVEETAQKPSTKGAQTVHKGCTKGAQAGAPNPIPLDPIPPTPTNAGGGGGVVEDDLVVAAAWAAAAAGNPPRQPLAFAAAVRRRLRKEGVSVEDLAALERWRAVCGGRQREQEGGGGDEPRRAASRAQLAALARAIGR